MVGGVGRVPARREVRNATRSLPTGPRNGKSASFRSGNSSRNARGFTTAPERECSPRDSAFSSTPMLTAVPSRWARRASSIAQARPAGPAPTIKTSSPIRSPAPSAPSFRMSRSSGSGGWYRAGTNRSPMELLYLFGELGHHVEQIPHDSVVRHLEDRGVFVLVDRHNDFGRTHPREVLDGTGDPDRDVQGGADRLAGLSHLFRVRAPTGVYDGARCAHRRASGEGRRQLFQHLEVRRLLEPPTPGHDDRRFSHIERACFRRLDLLHHHATRGPFGRRGLLRPRLWPLDGCEYARAQRDHDGCSGDLELQQGLARVYRPGHRDRATLDAKVGHVLGEW